VRTIYPQCRACDDYMLVGASDDGTVPCVTI